MPPDWFCYTWTAIRCWAWTESAPGRRRTCWSRYSARLRGWQTRESACSDGGDFNDDDDTVMRASRFTLAALISDYEEYVQHVRHMPWHRARYCLRWRKLRKWPISPARVWYFPTTIKGRDCRRANKNGTVWQICYISTTPSIFDEE